VVLPDLKPKVATLTPVASLAYRPDGKLLAAGGEREVLLLDAATGDLLGKLPGQSTRVTALAFSRDGSALAVASGAAGTAGEVRLYNNPTPNAQPMHTIKAHQDLIYDLTFSPDGKTLASCGYDRLIHLWDVATGKPLRDLKDHSDAVYSVAFSPDGTLLASAAADRAVKVWDVASGKRLYTLADATDWVYTLAWHPQGRLLAAAGVDKSIRVWEITNQAGRIVHSVFAHTGPVTRIAYGADGKTLYSVSEDRVLKAWDAARMVERHVYARQPEVPLALAVRPDQKQLAVGRYDGVLTLLEEATGKVEAEPLPVKPKPPVLNKITPQAGPRGQTLCLKLEGKYLHDGEIIAPFPGIKATLTATAEPAVIEAQVTIPGTTPAGVYPLSVKTPGGQTAGVSFTVDLFPLVQEGQRRGSPRTGQKIALPATVAGSIDRAGAVDFFRFEAKAGQEIGAQVLTAVVGSKLDAILQLTDGDGNLLTESSSGLLGYTCPQAGTYALGIRDREYRGEAALHYRLHVGDIPIVTAVYPLGIQRGTEADVQLDGVNLGDTRIVRMKAPADAAPGTRLPVPFNAPGGTPLGSLTVVAGEFAEVLTLDKDRAITTPATVNGRLAEPGSADVWRFQAKKGQRLILEVNAQRLGSPLDSIIEVRDAQGKPVPIATLRCVAMTYVTFRDHDSASTGIRIETWNDLAINDHMLLGQELLRIKALPKNPDDDCQFFSAGGQRLGYLGTTPTHHPNGQPMYKATIHPPGTTFPPNGLPVMTLYARNDDGGPGFGKDSRMVFDPPADGVYQVRIADARGQGSRQHVYRLTIRPPQPSYTVSFNPTAPAVSKGGAIAVTVNAERSDEYNGPIEVRLENLPAGFSAPATTIPAGENSTSFALFAEATAQAPVKAVPLKLVAKARIGASDVVREVAGGVPTLAEPGDIVTTTEQAEVTVKPGGEVRVTVKIERRNKFEGRVPLEVRGLPHGVRVLDIGLNGILITEKETTRTFVIYAEPWVEPTAHPFVVLARREGKNTEHAARSVLLKLAR
jgi:WD40 repeat protein